MTLRDLSELYDATTPQLCNWRKLGAPIQSPDRLLEWFANRGGRMPATFYLLEARKREALQAPKSPYPILEGMAAGVRGELLDNLT